MLLVSYIISDTRTHLSNATLTAIAANRHLTRENKAAGERERERKRVKGGKKAAIENAVMADLGSDVSPRSIL